MPRDASIALAVSALLFFGGCGAGDPAGGGSRAAHPAAARSAATSQTRPAPRFGHGPRYRKPPSGGEVDARRQVAGLRCTRRSARRFGVHLELFANGLDVVIPAGIGVAPRRVEDGAYVRSGRCSYPIRTVEPTGLIEVEPGTEATVGDFFALWGQPLSAKRMLGFRARRGERVQGFVDGERWPGDPRRISLARHAAIVLEINGYYPPTRRYFFPAGL